MSPGVRIIPRLDIKGLNLVKGVQLEGIRVLGRPEHFARRYYEAGADELLYLDVVASLYGRSSLLDLVSRTSREIFVPLTVGGGLRTIDDLRAVLAAGADKVAFNTAAVKRPEFIREASARFGASAVVVSIEAKLRSDGTYEAYVDNGRQPTGLDAITWASRAAELGAGEILLTSIDREGTGRGFDVELTRRVTETVPIPVIASGGAGSSDHVREIIEQGRADAVAIASIIHYAEQEASGEPASGVRSDRRSTTLLASRVPRNIRPVSLAELKAELFSAGIECRHEATN